MTHDKNKKTAVPALRFPEFRESGEWEEKTLGEIACVNPKSGELPNSFIYIDLESVMDSCLLKIKSINKQDAPSRAQRLLQKNDIIYQTVRPYQKNNFYFDLNSENYVASTGYAQIRSNENSRYLYQYLHTDQFVNNVLLRCTGTSYPSINSSDLALINIIKPTSLSEQQKIADCLMSLDDLIAAVSDKIMALRKHKKGLMQQLFPQSGKTTPALRFPEFMESGEWEEKKLGEIACVNPKSGELPNSFIYIDLESVVDSCLLKIKSINKQDAPSRAQRLLQKNDIIYQTVRPYQKNNFYFDLDSENYVASNGYAQIRSNENSRYLYQYLHTDQFVNNVLLRCTGTSYPSINSSDLALINIIKPTSPSEQQKIADCFLSIDEQISTEAQKLEALKIHKKGLVQGLFPQNINH